jgi:alkaline phosphatase D
MNPDFHHAAGPLGGSGLFLRKPNAMKTTLNRILVVAALAMVGSASTEPVDSIRVAFGSCAHQEMANPMWEPIAKHRPDVFVWMGDNVYGDTEDMALLQAKYIKQEGQRSYRRFLSTGVSVIGVWDDHDYGANDAGTEFPLKAESKELLLDFLGVPANAEVRRRPGVYQAFTYSHGEVQVKVVVLDTRWFRSAFQAASPWGYQPTSTGTMLGADQWNWLKAEVLDPEVDLLILGSSIQVIPEEHRWEKWANMPHERQKLLDVLAGSPAEGVLIISGDRHHAELSALRWGPRNRMIYELTASGMTHVQPRPMGEANSHRQGPLVTHRNWGMLRINRYRNQLWVDAEVRGAADSLFIRRSLFFNP